jgi:hypothetical protein
MGYLLTEGATVQCLHAGQAQPTLTSTRVKISGQALVTQSGPYTVSGCTFMKGNTPSPCVTAQWTSAAQRVKAGGVPVLLDDSQATCTPNGTGVNIVMTQTRVKGT